MTHVLEIILTKTVTIQVEHDSIDSLANAVLQAIMTKEYTPDFDNPQHMSIKVHDMFESNVYASSHELGKGNDTSDIMTVEISEELKNISME